MENPIVGDVVSITVPIFGLPNGTLGVCFEVYDLGEGPAGQFVFEGGEYDGFSPDEQERMLTFVRHCAPLSRYQFRNVTQVDRDYRDNLFEPALSGRYVQGSD